jgi:hypothetical protein
MPKPEPKLEPEVQLCMARKEVGCGKRAVLYTETRGQPSLIARDRHDPAMFHVAIGAKDVADLERQLVEHPERFTW